MILADKLFYCRGNEPYFPREYKSSLHILLARKLIILETGSRQLFLGPLPKFPSQSHVP